MRYALFSCFFVTTALVTAASVPVNESKLQIVNPNSLSSYSKQKTINELKSKSQSKQVALNEPVSKPVSPSFKERVHQYKSYLAEKFHYSKSESKKVASNKQISSSDHKHQTNTSRSNKFGQYSFSSYIPKMVIQGGGAFITQGSVQHININGVIGDDFSVEHHVTGNGIGGLGFYWHGLKTKYANLSYGVNAYYLSAETTGKVIQEDIFTNLAYNYSLTNWPIYLSAKAELYNRFTSKANITLDAGIGPNIMNANNFKESTLAADTLPDNIFLSSTSVKFSAMAGIGLKLNNVFASAPIECGYRFFYLGEGSFHKANTQVFDELKTGHAYANTILCSITV